MIETSIIKILGDYAADGNTCVPWETLREHIVGMLDVSSDEIDDAIISLRLRGGLDEGEVSGERRIFLPQLFQAERGVTGNLLRLLSETPKVIMSDIAGLISKSEAALGIDLSELQQEAVRRAIDVGFFVITGGPGTGKTTIIRAILDVFAHCGIKFAVAAPTGRAAKRITEATGFTATTIHRLLECSWDDETDHVYFGRNAGNKLDHDAIIIDEASMIDVNLMNVLLDAVPTGSRVVIVGDANQLPPVGPGSVLLDMLESGCVDSIYLTEIFRQEESSAIVTGAHRINSGEFPDFNQSNEDFIFIQRNTYDDILSTLTDLVMNGIPGSFEEYTGKAGIQILTPVKKGPLGNANLNAMIQGILNPAAQDKIEIKSGERVFREGDRVMQIKNNYGLSWSEISGANEGQGIFNGEMGEIDSIDKNNGSLAVVYEGVRKVSYDFSLLSELEHAYAITVHKSQGCEFPVVVMPVFQTAAALSARNLLYTAVTRGRKLVILVGSNDRLHFMIGNEKGASRYTGLCSFLRDHIGP